jgi:hypothetical protein
MMTTYPISDTDIQPVSFGVIHSTLITACEMHLSWSWSSSCGRQSVDQFVLASDLPLGTMARFYTSLLFSFDNYFVVLSRAPSLRRGRVCSLQCNR